MNCRRGDQLRTPHIVGGGYNLSSMNRSYIRQEKRTVCFQMELFRELRGMSSRFSHQTKLCAVDCANQMKRFARYSLLTLAIPSCALHLCALVCLVHESQKV